VQHPSQPWGICLWNCSTSYTFSVARLVLPTTTLTVTLMAVPSWLVTCSYPWLGHPPTHKEVRACHFSSYSEQRSSAHQSFQLWCHLCCHALTSRHLLALLQTSVQQRFKWPTSQLPLCLISHVSSSEKDSLVTLYKCCSLSFLISFPSFIFPHIKYHQYIVNLLTIYSQQNVNVMKTKTVLFTAIFPVPESVWDAR
jgi:hypothetical protein